MIRSRLLARKVWRDARALGGTTLALVVLVAIGTALYVLFDQTKQNLEESYGGFYRETGFADATVLVDNAPESILTQARLIPGVTAAEGRLVKDGTIVLRDRERSRVTGRFVGLPGAEAVRINQLRIRDGRFFSTRGECVVEQQFAAANEIRLGELLTLSYLGNRRDFVVTGTVSSPEYLYPAPSKETPWASPGQFGVVWLDQDALRQWLGLGRVVTEVHALCEPGTAESVVEVMEELGRRHGLRSSWDQLEQPSNSLLRQDIQGFQAMSVFFPFLFMFAAGLSLFSSLSRIIHLQTSVVGFLRASGFGPRQVTWHYVAQGALLAAIGVVPGVVGGHLASLWLTGLYANLLNLPYHVSPVYPTTVLTALASAVATGCLAAALPARTAGATPPAVAMRGRDDTNGGSRRVTWLLAATRHLPLRLRISARGLLRRFSRTVFAVGGLVCGTAVLTSTVGLYTSIMGAIDGFLFSLDYELETTFIGVQGEELAEAVSVLPGVSDVVLACSAPVRVSSRSGEVSLMIRGLTTGQRLQPIPTDDGRPAELMPGEVWLPLQVARTLHLEPGDPVRIEWSYSSRQRRVGTMMRVAGVMSAGMDPTVYTEYHGLRRSLVDRLYPEGGYGAMIACPKEMSAGLRRRLERDELVAAVLGIGEIKDQVASQMGVTKLFITTLVLFGAILAGAVLQSVSSVSILERLRELATLRSLGFSASATAWLAALELYLMAALALLLGLPLGDRMLAGYLNLFATETTSFPRLMPPGAYGLVVLIVFGLVALSLRSGMHRLRTMDLAQATKARE